MPTRIPRRTQLNSSLQCNKVICVHFCCLNVQYLEVVSREFVVDSSDGGPCAGRRQDGDLLPGALSRLGTARPFVQCTGKWGQGRRGDASNEPAGGQRAEFAELRARTPSRPRQAESARRRRRRDSPRFPVAALDRIVSRSARSAAIESDAVEKFSRLVWKNSASGAIPFPRNLLPRQPSGPVASTVE